MKQRTIAKEISLQGKGLHTGHPVSFTMKPAPAGTGIIFVRTDKLAEGPITLGSFDVIHGMEGGRYSAIKRGEAVIYTVEHLMSALSGMGVDNIRIEMDNDEPPGGDGSADIFLQALLSAGVSELETEKNVFAIREPITVSDKGACVTIVPAEDFRVSYSLDYPHPLLKQSCTFAINPEIFQKELAACRTFCLADEADAIRAKGLGQGASYENTLVFGPQGVLHNTLRFVDEPARHKMMDCVGDLYLLGIALKGHVFAFKSGHALNRALLKKIFEQKQRYESTRVQRRINESSDGRIDVRGIMDIIPHRYPFLLVDRIISIEVGKRAVAIKNVTMNEAFFQGHFPARPVMPGVLMVEAMAQVTGVVMLSNPELKGKLAFFMSVNNVKFRKVIEPGDQVVMEVEVIKARSRVAQAKGVCKVDGEVVCEAEMGFAFGG